MHERFLGIAAPDLGELERRYLADAMASGWISSIGPYVDRFERGLARFCETEHAVAVASGTTALTVTLAALAVGPGHEVIIPAHTFAAVAAAVRHVGAEPVLIDVHPDHWCLDPALIERALSPRTAAIIAVHAYGHPADLDPILAVAASRAIPVIEDGAEAHGARYKGRMVGSLATAACFSFYGNKILTTGEGGAVVTADPDLAARVRLLKDHAMSPTRRYYHTAVGYNFRMTNLQAAIGCAQLERVDQLLAVREYNLACYQEALAPLAPVLRLNPCEPWANPVNWLTCGLLQGAAAGRRDALAAALRTAGIDTRPFFVPLHQLPPYQDCRLITAETDASVRETPGPTPAQTQAERIARSGLNLPTGAGVSADWIAAIADVCARVLQDA